MSLHGEEVCAIPCHLGESPLWLPDDAKLAWLDILGRDLYRLDPATGEVKTTRLEAGVTAIGLTAGTELIAATYEGFGRVDVQTGAVRPLGTPLVDGVAVRMNDGAVAPDGSFWAGSYVPPERAGEGAVWQLEADGAVHRRLDGVTVSNGLDWYPDAPRTMAYVDSAAGGVDRLELDEDGAVVARSRLVDVPGALGVPDGLALDAEGRAWVAIWGGSQVHCYSAGGRLEEVVELPARHPSSCAFGGPDGATLYVTTARERLRDPVPADGRLYACAVGVVGLPARRFAGQA